MSDWDEHNGYERKPDWGFAQLFIGTLVLIIIVLVMFTLEGCMLSYEPGEPTPTPTAPPVLCGEYNARGDWQSLVGLVEERMHPGSGEYTYAGYRVLIHGTGCAQTVNDAAFLAQDDRLIINDVYEKKRLNGGTRVDVFEDDGNGCSLEGPCEIYTRVTWYGLADEVQDEVERWWSFGPFEPFVLTGATLADDGSPKGFFDYHEAHQE